MKKGFTLIEIMIYVTMLAVLLAATVEIVLVSSNGMSSIRSERKIFAAGEGAMETIIREIRQASDVYTEFSVFILDPGTLALKTVQTPGGSTVITRIFSLNSERIQKSDDGAPEFITPPDVRITSLIFWHNATTSSNLITVKIMAETGSDKNYRSHAFYGSATTRAKY